MFLVKIWSKLQTFWYTFKNSLINGKYYCDVLKAPFKFSLKYFITICIVLILAMLGRMVIEIYPDFQRVLNNPDAYYPKDLVVRIENGKLINQENYPYKLKVPRDWRDRVGAEFEYLVVIDPKAKPESIKKLKSLFLITENSFVMLGSQGELVKQAFDKKFVFNLNRDNFLNLFNNYLWVSLATASLGIFLSTFVTRIFTTLIYAIMVFLLSRAMRLSFSFKQVLQLTLHLSTFIYLISFLSILNPYPVVIDQFWYSLVLGVYAMVVFKEMRKSNCISLDR